MAFPEMQETKSPKGNNCKKVLHERMKMHGARGEKEKGMRALLRRRK